MAFVQKIPVRGAEIGGAWPERVETTGNRRKKRGISWLQLGTVES